MATLTVEMRFPSRLKSGPQQVFQVGCASKGDKPSGDEEDFRSKGYLPGALAHQLVERFGHIVLAIRLETQNCKSRHSSAAHLTASLLNYIETHNSRSASSPASIDQAASILLHCSRSSQMRPTCAKNRMLFEMRNE